MKHYNFSINWRYAIGEFLIVVLGIVVAFQLDSWKERQDELKLVNEYLADIRVGLETDAAFYQRSTVHFDSITSDINRTRAYLEQGQLHLPKDGQLALRNFTDWYRTYISNTAFEDLNNSGRLNLIENKQLRYQLIAYYQYLDFVKDLDQEFNTSLSDMKISLLDSISFHHSDELIIPDSLVSTLLNYLDQKESFIKSYFGHRSMCQQINADIIKAIDEV